MFSAPSSHIAKKVLAIENRLSALCLKTEVKQFADSEVIFNQKQKFTGIYTLEKGYVKITKSTDGHHAVALWIAFPSDILGLEDFFKHSAYSANAISLGKSRLQFIATADFQKLLENDRQLYFEVFAFLSQKANFLEAKTLDIAQKDTHIRLLEFLVFFVQSDGKHEQVELPYSIDDMAEILSTTKNYLLKKLFELSKENLLRLEHEKVIIKSKSRLLAARENSNGK